MSDLTRRPRIAIMGEFSAGKSTLCNILMSARTLPEKVTATQLPPVWMTFGTQPHVRVTLDGDEQEIAIEELHDVPVDNTLYVRVFLEQQALELCDFVDFPGISDPNMDPEVWARLIMEMDAVIWLTHSTQAWRQSEAAVWDLVPENVKARSLLLLTRWDKIISETDRSRVLRRVQKETAGLFDAVLPISLIEAMAAREDYDAWQASGAAAVMDQVARIIVMLQSPSGAQPQPAARTAAPAQPKPEPPRLAGPEPKAPEVVEEEEAVRVVPRRVKLMVPPRELRAIRAIAV